MTEARKDGDRAPALPAEVHADLVETLFGTVGSLVSGIVGGLLVPIIAWSRTYDPLYFFCSAVLVSLAIFRLEVLRRHGKADVETPETEEEHQDTLSMIEWANYSMSYMFYYSERPGTLAARKYADDIPEDIKKRRLNEVIRLQNAVSHRHNQADIGKTFKVLIEGNSRKSDQDFSGRNTQNKMVVFPKVEGYKPGDYAMVRVKEATSATLLGEIVPAS